MKSVAAITLLVTSFILLPSAFPHSGGLDSNGGHSDSRTGLYHCHRQPCFSLAGDTVGPVGDATGSAPFVSLYDRDDWPHWSDLDGDCQNTRDEVLIRDSLVPVTFEAGGRCDVQQGLWRDPYTGIEYREASAVSIDHLVPLRWAHGHGVDRWTRRQKETFANDPENLLVVETGVNSEKGAKGPDAWLPPRREYRCEYLRRFLAVVGNYGLGFVNVERDALARLHEACGNTLPGTE